MRALFAQAVILLLVLSAGAAAQTGAIDVTRSATSFGVDWNGRPLNGVPLILHAGKPATFRVKTTGQLSYCQICVKYRLWGCFNFTAQILSGIATFNWTVPANAPLGAAEPKDARGIGGICRYKDQVEKINGETSQASHPILVRP
jgi:hypothetical protein